MTLETQAMNTIWIGIDTGGTFTDLVLADLTTGATHYCMHASTTTAICTADRPRSYFTIMSATSTTSAANKSKP